MKRLASLLLGAAAVASLAAPASAQKSADTIRLAVNNTLAMLSQYHLPIDEASTFYSRVWESLIAYDERNKKFVPQLAKSWTRVNPTTIEFDLFENRTFHNGNKFDADDVVGMLTYLADPKVPLRYKDRYDWVKSAEKLGPYKVRVTTTGPNAVDLGNLAHRYNIFDIETLNGLADKEDYGRLSPHGTGYYKLAKIDKNTGMQLERFEEFNGDKNYQRAPVKRIHGVFLPDRQTQIAQLLTGGIDIIKNVIQDQANELKTKPGVAITAKPGGAMAYFVIDSAGVAGNKILTDVRVREAIHAAIDRKAIIKYIVPGGEGVAAWMDVPCFDSTVGCKYTKKAADYDPERAKKLLAEAGYPNGFDLVYDVYNPIKDIAVAIAGDLHKVGIRTTVVPDTIEVYRKKQGDNQLQSWSLFYPLGSFPDASQALSIWFAGKRAEYFNNDPIVLKAMEDGLKETDTAKREAIYQVAFDRITEQRYVLPISSIPSVYAHRSDVVILDNQLSTSDEYIGDFAFK
jgi:peptide/nickel transport system substrate-binding protein